MPGAAIALFTFFGAAGVPFDTVATLDDPQLGRLELETVRGSPVFPGDDARIQLVDSHGAVIATTPGLRRSEIWCHSVAQCWVLFADPVGTEEPEVACLQYRLERTALDLSGASIGRRSDENYRLQLAQGGAKGFVCREDAPALPLTARLKFLMFPTIFPPKLAVFSAVLGVMLAGATMVLRQAHQSGRRGSTWALVRFGSMATIVCSGLLIILAVALSIMVPAMARALIYGTCGLGLAFAARRALAKGEKEA
jgi:hypothetical protein